jgi:hypothetical protein
MVALWSASRPLDQKIVGSNPRQGERYEEFMPCNAPVGDLTRIAIVNWTKMKLLKYIFFNLLRFL